MSISFRNLIHGREKVNILADIGERSITPQVREVGKLKNLLKKTYLSRWVGRVDLNGNEVGGQMNNKESDPANSMSNYSVDFARSVNVFVLYY